MGMVSQLPAVLSDVSESAWQRWCDRNNNSLSELTAMQIAQSKVIFGLSDYIAESCINNHNLLIEIWQSGLLTESQRTDLMRDELNSLLSGCNSEQALLQVVRRFRRFHMVIIAWRELLQLSELDESLSHTSILADLLIEESLNWLYRLQCQEQGTPVNTDNEPQQLLVMAMGKLGGSELNFSSDIDLIFTYPEAGNTVGAGRSVPNQKFFLRLGQRLISALHQITADGFAYRVDMRLRPFGDSGPLVVSFSALEDYYQNQGRDWERYAMVKARVLGGTDINRTELEKMLKPFVYRRYVDYSAIDALRRMKAMIKAEVRRKGLKDNIKLGTGGIREVEFVAQTFQLIRGGREPELQVKPLQETLAVLARSGAISPDRVEVLLESYRFLRRVENVLQQIHDSQTQTLPADEIDRARLITALGFSDWDAFYLHVNRVMANIHHEFTQVIGGNEDENDDAHPILDLWHVDLTTDETLELLREYQLEGEDALSFSRALAHFKADYNRKSVGPRGRQTMEKLMPRLLFEVIQDSESIALLPRIINLLMRILNRTAYLELLAENDHVLTQLLRLCGASPMIAKQLSLHPILLDELLVPSHLYHPTPLHEYRSELQQFMLRIPEEDMEQQLEALRQYKQTQLLRIAAADIAGELPLMQVSDHLTWLAEAVVHSVVNLAWQQLTDKYGLPHNAVETGEKGFAVIGYGKLGGIELGYGSDLDLVFVHNCETPGMTNGDKPVDSRQFYLRLAQRIIHIFSTRTSTGILYEVDMRLRPSGNSGLLACAVSSFLNYQLKEAWTWEHQSLVRARLVYADKQIQARFNEVKRTVIAQQRDEDKLKKEVVEMRAKMRNHLIKVKPGEFDLKQSPGGITDIEFMMQYLVLRHAATISKIQIWSDNVRIISCCVSEGIMTEEQGDKLTKSYCCMRDEIHRLNLLDRKGIVKDSEFVTERKIVTDYWAELFS